MGCLAWSYWCYQITTRGWCLNWCEEQCKYKNIHMRMRVSVCVCVIFCHHSVWKVKSVVLFYSYISLLWYVGYDDFISMSNVFIFVLIIIITLLVLSLANMKMNILEKYLFSISDDFLHFFLFFHFIYFCFSSMYIFLINFSSLFFCFFLF